MRHDLIQMAGAGLLFATAMCWVGCSEEETKPLNSPPPQATTPVTASPAPATPPSIKPTDVHPSTAPASPAPPQTPIAPSTQAAPQDSKVATFAGLIAPKPATWISHPPSRQFSIAEFAVPGRDGFDQARIDVFQAGGTVQANIDRWKSQFRGADGQPIEPKVTTLEADGMPITLVEFAGEYKGMGAFNFTPNTLFLTAIVDASPAQLFVRFVGPAGTVEPNRQAFMEMIHGLRAAQPEK